MADWAAEIERAYRDILGRAPEAGAVDFYLGHIEAGTFKTVSELRQGFRNTSEADAQRAKVIEQAYKDVLGRSGDPLGVKAWAGLMKSGEIESVEQLRQVLGQSDEAKRRGTTEQRSARATVDAMLEDWGLGDLGEWAWEQIRAGNLEQLPALMRQTDQYKARFSGLEARRAAGLNVMSEAEYLNLEDDYRTVMGRYGIPRGTFDTQNYLGTLIAGDVSPSEINDRLRLYQDAAFNAPAEFRNQLSHLYGIDPGALTAYYIDPAIAMPALEAQYAAAGAGSASVRGGFGQLGQGTAERLAQLGAGANDVATFENLNRSTELFTGLGASEADQAVIDRADAAAAAFGGDATAADRMRKRAEQRVAAFGGGGGFAQGREGISGLGSANT